MRLARVQVFHWKLIMVKNLVATCHTRYSTPEAAARSLAESVQEQLGGATADVMIVFASPEVPYRPLLDAINAQCKPRLLVGCSSAGEFSGCNTGNASVSAMAIRADDILFNAAVGTGLRADRKGALDPS